MPEKYQLVTEDDRMEGPTTEEIIRGFFIDIDSIYVQITDDDDLTDDHKAGLIQMFEDIEGHFDYVKDIFGDLPESD